MNRKGGILVDPDVAAWQKSAATNKATLTKKQAADRARVRVAVDMSPELKESIERSAQIEETSVSQFAAFLLTWAVRAYRAGNAELREAMLASRERTRTPRFRYDVEAPGEWLEGTK